MDRAITINRHKGRIFGIFFLLLIFSVVFVLIAVYDVQQIGMFVDEQGKFIIMKVLCIILSPIMVFTTFHYFKELFNNDPILVVNERGFQENSGKNSVGRVNWDDIQRITVIPYMDNTVFISVHLKNPRKYIEDEKQLNKIRRKWHGKAFGEVNVQSLYFKKELPQVLEVIKHYAQKHNIGQNGG